MSIEFSCPACAKPYRVKDELAGKTARCVCGQKIQIPSSPEPATDPSDLLEGAEEPAPPNTSKTKSIEKGKETLKEVGGLLTGHGVFAPFSKHLTNTRSAIVKIAIGAIVGAIAGAQAIARNKGPLGIEPVLLILGAAAAGAGAASLLIVADKVGKRSATARWITIVAIMFLIVVAVVGYFLLDAFRMEQRAHHKHATNNSQQKHVAGPRDPGTTRVAAIIERSKKTIDV